MSISFEHPTQHTVSQLVDLLLNLSLRTGTANVSVASKASTVTRK